MLRSYAVTARWLSNLRLKEVLNNYSVQQRNLHLDVHVTFTTGSQAVLVNGFTKFVEHKEV
jgi:hypothetical protein